MHELSLAEGLINLVDSQQETDGFSRVLEIKLRVGEYSGIVTECLREFFPIAARGTAAEGAELVVEEVKAAFKCPDCGYSGPIDRADARCPVCGGERVRMTAGREFYVESLKVE